MIPRPEYPRPQFARKDWINLNGEWQFEIDAGRSGKERKLYEAEKLSDVINVPFCPESRLSGLSHTDFMECVWYMRTVELPADWTAAGRRTILNIGACDYETEVFVNGKYIDRHIGGYVSFAMDITSALTAGANKIVICATDLLRSQNQPGGKQCRKFHSIGCSYTRTTGIWQTVWLENMPDAYIRRIKCRPSVENRSVFVEAVCENADGRILRAAAKFGGKVVGTRQVRASNSSVVVIPVKKARLWSPEDPFLYDLTYEVVAPDGQVLDAVKSYVGMRKVHIEGNKIYLNNEPYYQRLVLDQGFYPDGIWTAPSDDALRRDIELGLAAGFNGARLHQKVFEERYYYWADRLGYITWGESPSWGMDANDVETARNFLSEWAECVVRDRNHPSLLTWTPMNEEWWPDNTQFPRFASDVYDLTGRLDPTRPVNTVSGGAVVRTDIWAVHNYEQNPAKLKEKIFSDGTFFHPRLRTTRDQTRNIGFNEVKATANYAWPQYDGSCPYLVDEFGGIKWVKDQEKQATDSQTESWGYGQAPRTLEEFYTRLEGQVDALLSLSGQVWGYCYTQLTDVEQEQNGIYCYDRSAKFDMDRIKAIFSKRPEHPAR